MRSSPAPAPSALNGEGLAQPDHVDHIERSREATEFLQRFGAVIATGRNADRINDAAALITTLADRIVALTAELAATRSASAALATSCAAHEARLAALVAEAGELRESAATTEERFERQRSWFAGLAERFAQRIEAADDVTAKAVQARQTAEQELARLTRECTVVPQVEFEALQAQFSYLAEECTREGNLIAAVLADIGAATIARRLGQTSQPAVDQSARVDPAVPQPVGDAGVAIARDAVAGLGC